MNAPASIRASKSEKQHLILTTALDALALTAGIAGHEIALDPADQLNDPADSAVELLVEDKQYSYLVEIKHIDRTAMLHQVKQQFAATSKPFLLAAPRISSELADKCREIGVRFIDSDGNAYLRGPGLLVFVKGQRGTQGAALIDTLTGGSAGSGSAARLIFILLCAPALLNAPYRLLGEMAGVSLGAIGPVFNDLAKRGFITNAKGSRRFLEKERLMNEWVATYPLKLRPKLVPRRFRAADRNWWQTVDITQFGAVWGGEVAADKLTNYLKPEKVTIYMDAASMGQHLSKLVIQNKLRADPDGDIEVLEKFWKPLPEHTAADCVPPLLTYADLVASMEPRNLEVATRIYQKLNHAD